MSLLRRISWVSIATVLFLVSSAFAGESGILERENGVLENTQVALLLLSGLVFVMQSFRVEHTVRFILWMGAWLSPSVIFRELDIEKLAVPQWFIWVGSGMGRNLILGMGWIVLCILAVKSYSEWKGHFGRVVRSRAAIFVCAAGIMLFLGAAFDHGTAKAENGKLWEEILETIGYFLLLPAAFLSPSILRD
jgi:hypothetical protein